MRWRVGKLALKVDTTNTLKIPLLLLETVCSITHNRFNSWDMFLSSQESRVSSVMSVLTIQISVKSGKDSTNTLSLVIHRVRFRKTLQKNYISIQRGGGGDPGNHQFPEFHLVFLFSWAPPLLLHRFSLLLPVQLL